MTWQAAALAILGLVLTGAFVWYERRRPPARVLALVAALAALAVVGRLAFAAIPNVKPTTDIVLFAGYALGGVPGFVVGAVTALVSNVFLSQGPWTPWQMVGWGGVGVGGALLARAARGRQLGRVPLALACGVAGALFGIWMDGYQWTLAARQDLDTYLAISGTSLPYNVAHVIGNVIFCLLIGPVFVRALRRYRRRFEVDWRPRAARAGAAAAVVAALALVTALSAGGAPATAAPSAGPDGGAAASPAARAARYLLRSQNRDGGFGAAPGLASNQLHSGWAALGLASAGHNPRDVRRGRGRSIAAYLERGAGGLSDIGEVERTMLVLKAAGLSARTLGGRDLVGEVVRRRRDDGSIAGYVSYSAFGVLALKAAGEGAGSQTVAWLVRSQNPDGGFGVARSSPSDVDMTGVALQALAAVGRSGGARARRAVEFLRGAQNGDGGFGFMPERDSNAQSTAYGVQGLVAVGAAGDAVARAGGYLARLQRDDGSISYSDTSRQTPVWVTAQALLALRRAAFPLATVPREPRPQSSETEAKQSAAGGAAAPAGAATPTPAADAPKGGETAGGGASAPAAGGTPAPGGSEPPAPVPQPLVTPDADPADAASAERAAARAGDEGVPEGMPNAAVVALALLGTLVLLWLVRRPLLGVARRRRTAAP